MKKDGYGALCLTAIGLIAFEVVLTLSVTIAEGMMGTLYMAAMAQVTNSIRLINCILYIILFIMIATDGRSVRKNVIPIASCCVELLAAAILAFFSENLIKWRDIPAEIFADVEYGLQLAGIGMLVGMVISLPLGFLMRKCDMIVSAAIIVAATFISIGANIFAIKEHLGYTGGMLAVGFIQAFAIWLPSSGLCVQYQRARQMRIRRTSTTKGEGCSMATKSKLTAILLSIFTGGLGIDRFYLGYTGSGVAKLLTAGGLGIWSLIDLIMICTGSLHPADGSPWEEEVQQSQSPAGAQTNATNAAANDLDALERLAKLHEQGVLTDEEFEQKKQMILQKI